MTVKPLPGKLERVESSARIDKSSDISVRVQEIR